jgi:hypothetical protein
MRTKLKGDLIRFVSKDVAFGKGDMYLVKHMAKPHVILCSEDIIPWN